MNNNTNSNMNKEEVRNRFRQLNRNADIVATVMYNDNGEMQVENGWKIIFRNDWFGLGQNGMFVMVDNYSKFEIVDGILVVSEPIDGDYPESISITFEEHKCVSF